jgi:hypothetical protein
VDGTNSFPWYLFMLAPSIHSSSFLTHSILPSLVPLPTYPEYARGVADDVTIDNCIFNNTVDNSGMIVGGAVTLHLGERTTIRDSIFDGNGGYVRSMPLLGFGGSTALLCYEDLKNLTQLQTNDTSPFPCSVIIQNCSIVNNYLVVRTNTIDATSNGVASAGAFYIASSHPFANVTITTSSIVNNTIQTGARDHDFASSTWYRRCPVQLIGGAITITTNETHLHPYHGTHVTIDQSFISSNTIIAQCRRHGESSINQRSWRCSVHYSKSCYHSIYDMAT